MKYKLIWIDDQYIDQPGFITEAELEDIELICFKTSREGMAELERNLSLYDGVILDAKVYKDTEDELAKLDGLAASIHKIIALSSKRIIPYFIFTAHPDLLDSETFSAMLNGKSTYLKNLDNEKLFKDIKSAADNEPYTKLRHKYEHVFNACNNIYIHEDASSYLLDILYSIENPGDKFDDEKYFNGLRKVIEYVFRASNKIGILHDACIPDGIINLTWSSMFLAGIEVELKPSIMRISSAVGYFPMILANNVKHTLDITSAASHTESEEKENAKVNFSDYKKNIQSNYLLYSLAYQVMDLILWFKEISDANPDISKNKSNWVESTTKLNAGSWIKGSVVRIADNGFGTFQSTVDRTPISILPKLVTAFGLKTGDRIEVITKTNSTSGKVFIDDLRMIS